MFCSGNGFWAAGELVFFFCKLARLLVCACGLGCVGGFWLTLVLVALLCFALFLFGVVLLLSSLVS